MTKFETVVYLQGDDAREVTDLIEEKGEDAGYQYLMQWEYGEWTGDEPYDKLPVLAPVMCSQYNYERSGYIMSYMLSFDAAALYRVVEES